jgi:hypothetical protein
MTELYVALLTLVGLLIVFWGLIFLLAGANSARVGLALSCFRHGLRDTTFAEKVRPLLQPTPATPPKPSGEPLRLLTVLQRDSRFLDFFMDDLGAAGDDQILAFVKKMHPECQASLKDHLVLEPVIAKTEGETVEVPPGFDPSVVRLLGNVTGQPPFRGTLEHRGWRVREIKLAAPLAGQDEFVVQPAEVNLP